MPALPLAVRGYGWAVQRSPGKKAATKGLQGNQAVGVKEETSLEGGISGLFFALITN